MNFNLNTWMEKREWSKYEQYVLLVEYWPTFNITHELGNIKKTNDGRWRWTVKDSNDHRFKLPKNIEKLQGTCQTKEEAISKLENIWGLK